MTLDRQKLDKLLERNAAMKTAAIKFGSMGPDGTPSPPHPDAEGLTVAQLFQIHEFGLGVTERPVIRQVVHGKRAELARLASAAAVAIVRQGASADAATQIVGPEVVKLLHESFDRVGPPIEPQEDGDAGPPLADSGALRESLRWAKADP